jgi:murein DD-endopeptidase MepM/ murein hydrolase activator NlpD
MKIVLYILLLFSCSVYVAKGDDFFKVEEQNKSAERDAARVQADYARQQDDLKQATIRADQQRAIQQEKKAAQERADAIKSAAINAKIAEDKANERVKAANEERLKDKSRAQALEDEERAYQIKASELKLQEGQAEADEKTADADLKKAITAAKLKRVNEEVDLQHKRESSSIDVVQSEADAIRNVSSGAGEMLSGFGSTGKYQFYAVIGLILLALVLLIGGWLFYFNSRKAKTEV